MRMPRSKAALTVMALVVAGLLTSASRLDAGPKKGDGQAAKCAYLLSVISYPYTNSVIKLWATSLYNSQGCQPALTP